MPLAAAGCALLHIWSQGVAREEMRGISTCSALLGASLLSAASEGCFGLAASACSLASAAALPCIVMKIQAQETADLSDVPGQYPEGL